MYATLMLASLVFGTAVVDPPTGGDQSLPGMGAPTSSIPLQPGMRSQGQRASHRSPSRGVPASSVRNRPATSEQSTMPASPTDSDSSGGGQPYMWLPPTANAPQSGAGGRSTSGFYGQSRMPYSPTHARPGQPQSNASMQDAQLQRMRIEAARQATTPVQQPASKAFAGQQMRTGGVSPYMNLYRTGNAFGTIDNYTTLVRPELDQRQANQRFGSEISNLELNSRVQGFNLNQLHRDTQNLQGVKYQQFFMNYGDFYPGAR